MPDVYLYVPREELEDVTDCGMKLSEYRSFDISVTQISYDCIRGYLHPMDAVEEINDGLVCVRVEVKEQYCYVGDADLRALARRSSSVQEKYQQSIVPIKEYKLGSYRKPECYITCTLIGDDIKELENTRAMLLYNNSEELYYNCLSTFLTDECGITQKDIMACVFGFLRYQGLFRSSEMDHKTDVFYNNRMKKIFSVGKVDCDDVLEKFIHAEWLNDNVKDGE